MDILIEKYPALLIPMIALLGATLVFTVWLTGYFWLKAKQTEIEANLKKDMLARDFSAADIERVLLASACQSAETSSREDRITDNEYYLVEKMLDDEHPVEEIERLVRAFGADRKVSPNDRVRV